MQDRIPVNPGRVLVTPENGGAAYYATLTRADNPTQEGTPLNKASLLKDATAAKFGLGADAVPDDVFSLLSRFHSELGNEYVWEKAALTWKETYHGLASADHFWIVYGSTSATIPYADSIWFNDDGTPYLVNPQEISITSVNVADVATVLSGKYVDNTTTIVGGSGSVLERIGVFQFPIGGTIRYESAWPGFYINTGLTTGTILITGVKQLDVVGYVNSPDSSAYPIDDGYTYTAFGRLGKALDGVKYASGTYEATGTYGTNNPCSLTFDFVPKFLAIAVQYSSNNQNNSQIFVLPKPGGGMTASSYGGSLSISTWEYTKKVYTYASADGKTVYWLSADSSTHQMNQSGFTYEYFALGF